MDVDEAEIREQIAAEREELAELLAGLPAEAWDEPTLCEGWRVREVVAHMTMPFHSSTWRFLTGMLRARGDFNRMADRCARQDAEEYTPEAFTAMLRENARFPWKPPGGGYAGALSHDVIHGLDITVALDLDRRVPYERLRTVLGGSDSPRSRKFFGTDLAGVRLQADDLDWSLGSGEPLTASAQDLLLVLCGRRLPPGRLHGAPAARFTAP
ncbi:maleylpyruvate isomerase family mycothiol-dependent enzyme [Actinocorallia populi]|uniref:maleylpyruvate isomerase family mycothiol-dependent enzyme n=1 Tax=Actinocorallia populi TaxID=2079200 RepID=UPI0018E54013|nr:maleylpyruvate isomerase family mycothiol-dependent enzyme [Actinocorallia populi]